MHKVAFVTILGLVLSLAGPACGQGSGSPAPALEVSEWVKGEPVNLAEGKGENVYVVEFWATWCGPCRTNIPHMTELQAEYADQGVVVVAISKEDINTVKPFVEEQGDAMDYHVAVDGNGRTWQAYMDAFGVGGIPHAFIVDKSGAIAWHGHPARMEPVLEDILAGSHDPQGQALAAEIGELFPVWAMEYMILSKYGRDTEAADAVGEKMLEHAAVVPETVAQVAYYLTTEDNLKYRNADFLAKLGKAAYDAAPDNPYALDAYARALFAKGDAKKAVEIQEKAISVAEKNAGRIRDEEFIPALKSNLEKYKAGASS